MVLRMTGKVSMALRALQLYVLATGSTGSARSKEDAKAFDGVWTALLEVIDWVASIHSTRIIVKVINAGNIISESANVERRFDDSVAAFNTVFSTLQEKGLQHVHVSAVVSFSGCCCSN